MESGFRQEVLNVIGRGLALLDTDPNKLMDETVDRLFEEIGADQCLEKFDSDRRKAFAWAHLEERRKIVSTLVRHVLVRKGKGRERIIEPVVVVELPITKREILSYGDQSLEYIEGMVR